jgi:hypothetical protein
LARTLHLARANPSVSFIVRFSRPNNSSVSGFYPFPTIADEMREVTAMQ